MAISQRFTATRFPSGVVGSLPRPLMVKEMLPAVPGPESAEAARSPQMDAAVRYAIAVQEQAGLDLVSDGEWRRHAYTHIIADIATGFSADLRQELAERVGRWTTKARLPVVIVTHDEDDLRGLAGERWRLVGGEITAVEVGPTAP